MLKDYVMVRHTAYKGIWNELHYTLQFTFLDIPLDDALEFFACLSKSFIYSFTAIQANQTIQHVVKERQHIENMIHRGKTT